MAICLHKLVSRAATINPILLQGRLITTSSPIAFQQQISPKVNLNMKNNKHFFFIFIRLVETFVELDCITSIQSVTFLSFQNTKINSPASKQLLFSVDVPLFSQNVRYLSNTTSCLNNVCKYLFNILIILVTQTNSNFVYNKFH